MSSRKAAACGILLAGIALATPADESPAPLRPIRPTGVHLNETANQPSETAWELFLHVNQPVEADPAYSFWETWADVEEVFGDPNCERFPPWPTGVRQKHLDTLPRQQEMFRNKVVEVAREQGLHPPSFEGSPVTLTEVRMNRPAYEWIATKRLWYLNDQEEAFSLHVKAATTDPFPEGAGAVGRPVDVSVEFTPGSIFVKAAWKPIAQEDKPRYHWHLIDGTPHGLTAFHIISKALPQWFWATWEHADNPGRARAVRLATRTDQILEDRLTRLFEISGLDRARWGHYKLIGTQTTFTDTVGHPALLGNSVLEDGFLADSSCMTCHARSTIGRHGRRLEAFEPRPHVGPPDPRWFTNRAGTEPVFLQLDFVWSLARAKRRDPKLVHPCRQADGAR